MSHRHSHPQDEDMSSFIPDASSFSDSTSFTDPSLFTQSDTPMLGGGISGSASFAPLPNAANRFEFSSTLPTPFFDQEHSSHTMMVNDASSAPVSASNGNKTVVIASTVAGSVVAVALAIGLFLFFRKRQRQHAREAAMEAWKMEAGAKSNTFARPMTTMPLAPPHTHSPTAHTTRSTAHMSTYHQRMQKTMSKYPRPDSVLTTHTDASLAPNVLGMVNGGAGGFASWKQRTVLEEEDVESVYTQEEEEEEGHGEEGWVDAEHVPSGSGHQGGVGGRRPSAFEGVSWPRRGRINTGTEVFGMM